MASADIIRGSVVRQVTIVFALLIFASWAIPGFVPKYYPMALASMLRNVHFGQIDFGVFYWGIVATGFVVEAVVVVGSIRVLDTLYRLVRERVTA